MFGKKDDQVSEASKMTPEGGADGTPGTEDATPGAVDTQHSPHEGNRDYSRAEDPHNHTHADLDDRATHGHDRGDEPEAPQTLVSTTDTPEHEQHAHGERVEHGDRVVDGTAASGGCTCGHDATTCDCDCANGGTCTCGHDHAACSCCNGRGDSVQGGETFRAV